MEANNSGKVWIKDGKLHTKDPGEGGNFPTVTPGDNIDLFINGIKIEEKTTVTENDLFELREKNIVISPGKFKITIPPDGLTAILDVETGLTQRYYPTECAPEENITIMATSEERVTCPFTFDVITQEINKRSITHGLKQGLIESLLEKPENGSYIIAKGTPPGETIDERIEIIAKKKSDDNTDDRNKKIDFREMAEILSVEEGAVLAIKYSGTQGRDGMKVTGKTITPPKPFIYNFMAGKGAEITDDGFKAVAALSGSPIIKRMGNKYFFDVQPVYNQRGDIDLASGNIHFKGDIVVQGSVREGMSVIASGKVEIHGMVFESKISALKGITVKQNITGSRLLSGGNSTLFNNFFRVLDPIRADLVEIAKLLPGLAQLPQLQNVKTGQLVQVLIDKKYPRIPALINELEKFTEDTSFGLPPEMSELTRQINTHIRGLNVLKLETPDKLKEITDEISASHASIERMAQKKSNIFFAYAINSRIESSGDVTVTGRGCINTTIHAGGKVNIVGVFRGGDIFAGGDVVINEVGSELGAKTLIRTGEKRKVILNKVNEGVRVQIGDRQFTFPAAQNNVRVEMAKDGNILVANNIR